MAEQTLADKYDVLEQIGRGSFGVIRKVRRKSDGAILCRKEINYNSMQKKERDQLHAEFSILHSLNHPNIVGYYHRDHIKDSKDLHLYMEYCSGGDLGNTIKKLKAKKEYASEDYIWDIFAQIVTALYRCHYGVDPPQPDRCGAIAKPSGPRLKNQVMILHRDLKPENIFLGEDNSVKLGDFGLSKVMQSHDFASTYVGTPYYMSPEICAAERYTLHSDIWALGCIMYELCTTKVPFNAASHIQLVQKINQGRVDPIPTHYSQDLQETIKACLRINPLQRPDTSTLMNHGMLRLAREKREVAMMGKKLRKDRDLLALKLQDLGVREAAWEAERKQWMNEIEAEVSDRIEDNKRREWEVKARLEIDRQVQTEKERLHKQFDVAVQAQVEAELKKCLPEIRSARPPSPPPTRATSFAENNQGETPPVSDLSNLSLESSVEEKPNVLHQERTTPPRRKRRGPLARSRTQLDSPMDVTMAEPSPMSIAGLSLSPRRTAAADVPSLHNNKNIFARAAAQKSGLSNRLPTPPSLSHSTIAEEDDDDDLPALPSPTRAPVVSDPFKAPSRPGLLRQKTAPMGRIPNPPSLFPSNRQLCMPQSPPNQKRPNVGSTLTSGSPTRKPDDMYHKVMARHLSDDMKTTPDSGIQIAASQTKDSGSHEKELIKKVMHRNLREQGGKTLVELGQARAGGPPMAGEGAMAKGTSGGENNWRPVQRQDVIVWDPEVDDMPSPFLVRGVRRKI